MANSSLYQTSNPFAYIKDGSYLECGGEKRERKNRKERKEKKKKKREEKIFEYMKRFRKT